MPTKAQRTTRFIIETVSPIFNKHGYTATSLSDITQATGLTKGAIYGNFKNKESLALAAFKYNSQGLINAIKEIVNAQNNPVDQLFSFTKFFAYYHDFTHPIGGCPILNVGVDSKENNPLILEAVRETIEEIQDLITNILDRGEREKVFHIPLKSSQFSKQLYTMLMGAVSMSSITQDEKYLKNTVAYIDYLIKREINLI